MLLLISGTITYINSGNIPLADTEVTLSLTIVEPDLTLTLIPVNELIEADDISKNFTATIAETAQATGGIPTHQERTLDLYIIQT